MCLHTQSAMAASRIDASLLRSTVVVETPQDRRQIPDRLVRLHRNGVEFRSKAPFQLWTEMTVTLDAPGGGPRQEGTGVVVACEGNRHWGYTISVLFLGPMTEGAERTRQSASDQRPIH